MILLTTKNLSINLINWSILQVSSSIFTRVWNLHQSNLSIQTFSEQLGIEVICDPTAAIHLRNAGYLVHIWKKQNLINLLIQISSSSGHMTPSTHKLAQIWELRNAFQVRGPINKGSASHLQYTRQAKIHLSLHEYQYVNSFSFYGMTSSEKICSVNLPTLEQHGCKYGVSLWFLWLHCSFHRAKAR